MKQATERVRDPWFCLPVLVCMVADAGVSLACQPAAYWSDPSAFHEGNPAWAILLARGPAGMFVLLAHSYGAASWLHVELPDRAWWWGLVGLLVVEAVAFAVYWHLSPACGRHR